MVSCFSALFPRASRSATSELAPLLSEKFNEKPPRTTTSSTTTRLEALRAELEAQDIDIYVIPTADGHNSEHVGAVDQRRVWISGFTGSAGIAIVSHNDARLFTDSRYYVQAGKELDSNWTLMKVGLQDVPSWDEYLASLPKGTKVGLDPKLLTYSSAKSLLAQLSPRKVSLVLIEENLVDKVWTDQPPRANNPIVVHPIQFSGKPASEKIASLREYLAKSYSGSSFLATSLDNLAWLLNLRGSDILYSPFFYGYLLVGPQDITLWIQDGALSEDAAAALQELGVGVESYDKVWEGVKNVKIVSSATTSWALVQEIGESNLTVVTSPIAAAQAIKNPVELEGFRRAYLRDGAAWVRWAAWLDFKIRGGAVINEWDAAEKLTIYRETGENYVGLAYENISATGENAALPHYEPHESGSSVIDRISPYLNDSGPQYLDGTIDTTRTVHFGKPTKEQKRAFTRVLQGHIAIDSLIFPEGTNGGQIDVLARSALWKDGMNYLHGTGHGIGSFGGVHEGPQGISRNTVPFVPGHVQSNEPGYYEVGSYGIRIESILGVKEVSTRRGFGDTKWLGFERFTVIPIQSALVDFSLLSVTEIKWLRAHNKLCCKRLFPLISEDKRAVRYLKKQ